MADITTTRRKKVLAHIAQNGGVMAIGPLHDWSGLKLLAAHQAFSQLMEGLTDDGLLGWDGQIFTLTAEGRDAVEGGGGAPADSVGADPVVADPVVADPVVADPVVADPVVAAAPLDRHVHEHTHDHAHDHAHDHPPAAPAPAARAVTPLRSPTPTLPPHQKKGVRGFLKSVVKGLLKG